MKRQRRYWAALFLAVAVVSPNPLLAASANTSGRFGISAGHDKTIAWYEANRASVFNAANCRVLQDLGGGKYFVQTNTPGGVCQYVIQETREQKTTKDGQPMTIYRLKYVRNSRGRLVDFELTIAMTGQAENKTDVSMWMMANVSGRFVPVSAVSGVLERSKSGVTSYITNNAR